MFKAPQEIPDDNLFETILQPVIDEHSKTKDMTNSMSEYALNRLVGYVENDYKYTDEMNEVQSEVHQLLFECEDCA
jgi:hypothetical protein